MTGAKMAEQKEVISGLPENSAGAAPVDVCNKQSRPSSGQKGQSGTLHWFAYVGREPDSLPNENVSEGKDTLAKDREERLRALKEKQNEERQRKLEELRQQALAAQKFREQKEEERRRRMEELRQRDTDKRMQVEERKRQIWEAERDRREAILRKNQEREARIDSKRKNERSSIVFAFGSSTPRMLEPADTGGSFWGTRRATSTSNVMMFAAAPLTRRSSERELDGAGKKRATSASGLDRKPGEDMKMSTSMYEVFHWNTTPEPVTRSTQRAKSISGASSIELAAFPHTKIISRAPTNDPTLIVDGRNFSSAPQTPSSRVASIFSTSTGGDEVDVQATPVYVSSARVNRRKTDLMPTIPSPRDLTPRRGAAPGRAFSMSRLDQLAQPRTRRGPPPPVIPSPATTNKSMSRSMSHLAAAAGITSKLRRSEASKSMVQLSSGHAPTPPPRVNRTERLRQRAKGLRSGEATPSPRPLSALSQHSVNSVGSGVSLRARPTAAPRRPRPFSIAVTGVSHEPAHRHSIAGELKTAKLQSPSSEKEVLKPPLPKVHATKKQTKPETPPKKSIDKLMKHAKASPRVTPKATPLQSPGSENAPSLPQELPGDSLYELNVMKEEIPTLPLECDFIEPEILPESIVADKSREMDIAEDVTAPEITPEPDKKDLNITPKEQYDDELGPVVIGTDLTTEQEVDMTASMIAKTRITTEEEAKAALAERRRLAREQAEREAELERQRLEEEKRKEEERLRQEEEEQRCFEEEQLRLVEEARKSEEQRLLLAIQENERREEEERKRREEEAKAKAEKEEAEKKAREEAERQRKEMDERLKKEEEERIARRKRVEAIMLRTRGKNTTPTSTPTKGQLEGDVDVDFVKETSPLEDVKGDPEGNVDPTNNGQSVQVNDIVENGKVSASETKLIDSSGVQPMETSQDSLSSACSVIPPSQSQQSNGHRNGVQYSDVDFVNVDNVKQNNTTNNILDFSEFDTFSTNNVLQPVTDSAELEQILDLSTVPTTGKLANEDNVNSNVTSNGPNAPLIAFQDNLTKKQDSNSVTDLLS